MVGQHLVDVGVDGLRHLVEPLGLGQVVADGVPLIAEGGFVVGMGSVGRVEEGVGKGIGEEAGQADQIIAVGADAVQHDDD